MGLKLKISKREPNEYSYGDIKVGQVIEFERLVTEEMVNKFAELTEDYNPLHTDEKYAKTTRFKERIVHGMLLGSLFSTLVGMHCPGKRNLYLTQQLNFRSPLRLNKKVKIRGEVINKVDSIKMIAIKTVILDEENNIIVDGEAKVQVD